MLERAAEAVLFPGDERGPVAVGGVGEDFRQPPLPDLPDYVERLRLCVPGQVYVLEERRP